MIVNHLDHLQEIVLVQFLQLFGQFVHIKCLAAVGSLLLFLLSHSCTDFADTLVRRCSTVRRVTRHRTRIAEGGKENRFGILECYDMLDFVFCLLEVEIVKEFVDFARDVLKVNLEFELTPTVFCDAPWRRFEYFRGVSMNS